MTKIDIISGFLGAGKTTFIKKMLKEAFGGEQVVLIENEFGEIGIDGGFLKESGIEIREMNSGCICCSLVGDFGKSLKEVVGTYHPDRILIEPSGVGKLSDVIKAVQDVQEEIDAELNSFTTVVDAMKCRLYRNNFGEFFSNQVEYAGAIILSRTDKAQPEKVEESYQILRELNEKAPIITTPIAELPGDKLLETMEHSKTLEEELLAEIMCPECGGHHEHGESSDAGTTITMKDGDAAMKGTGTIMRKRGIVTEKAVGIIMRKLGIVTEKAAGTIMRKLGIVTEKAAGTIMRNMSIAMRSTQILAAAAMTTITMTTVTIMRMRCSQAGEERRLRPIQKRKLSIF